MKLHDNTKYLLKNGDKRTMWWGDGPYLLVVTPSKKGMVHFNIDGTTIDRALSEFDVVSLADIHIVPERRMPTRALPKKE